MPFTPEQEQHVKDALNMRPRPCPGCQANDYELNDELVVSPLMSVSTRGLVPGQGLAQVAAICKACGLISFYSLPHIGLKLTPAEQPTELSSNA